MKLLKVKFKNSSYFQDLVINGKVVAHVRPEVAAKYLQWSKQS